MKKIIVTGAGFGNMGAEAMIFVVVNELRHLYKDVKIIVANSGKCPNRYKDTKEFEYVETGKSEYYYIASKKEKAKWILKTIYSKIRGRKTINLRTFERVAKDADAIIDISGFALGDQWSDVNCLTFLSRIQLAKDIQIPIILMPQSFGPFNFQGKQKLLILKKIDELMSYPQRIYTREKQGYELLKNSYHLNNVKMASDIVLSSKEDVKDGNGIYTSRGEQFKIKQNSIAIIPNAHCYDYGKDKIIDLYEEIIKHLLSTGKYVYLIRHSKADENVCQKVKKVFEDDPNVILCNNIASCFEFSDIIKEFKFVIASRYHSVVHSYKKNTPCIVIGWATKYHELLKSMGQDGYFNDIRTTITPSEVIKMIKRMDDNIDKERAIIGERLEGIQNAGLFVEVQRLLNNN